MNTVPVEHPAWCDPLFCGVVPGDGGLHRSLPHSIRCDNSTGTEGKLQLWQSTTDGNAPFVSMTWTTTWQPLPDVYDLTTGQARELRFVVSTLLDAARAAGATGV